MNKNILVDDFAKKSLSNIILPLAREVVGGLGVGGTTSIDGLLVLCEPWVNMREGDIIRIYLFKLNEPEDAADPIFERQPITRNELNGNIFILIPPDKIQEGWFYIFYTVTHPDSGLSDRSAAQALWVKFSIPGNFDPNPQTPNINDNLAAPELPLDVSYNGVDAAQAKKGVPVIIAPYINMHVRDKIRLSWGGVILVHEVQESEVGEKIIIIVDEKTIQQAGDNEDLVITYEIRDEVNNSSKWSPSVTVSVYAMGVFLAAPIVKEASENTLDYDRLEGSAIMVQVIAYPPDFAKNDSVRLTLAGLTVTGDEVSYEDYMVIGSVPSVLEFSVAESSIAPYIQSNFTASYTLIKSSDDRKIPSRKTTVAVTGTQPSHLPAPEVPEAVSTILDSSLPSATVIIPLSPLLTLGTEIVLFWTGVTANGDQYSHYDAQVVTSLDKPITFALTSQAIDVLAGGSVTVSYQLISNDNVVMFSDKLQLSVTATLPAPLVPDSVNGNLDPDAIISSVLVQVPPWNRMSEDDRVDLYWMDMVGDNNFIDWLVVSVSALGKPVNFRVPKSYVNSDKRIRIYYIVTKLSGMVMKSAETLLTIRHIEENDLAAPILESVVNGQLNLDNIAASASLKIPAYGNMQVGDIIRVYLEGNAIWQDDYFVTNNSLGKEIIFDISKSILLLNNNNKITLRYDVVRITGSVASSSVTTVFLTSGSVSLPPPTLDEANEMTVFLDSLSSYATLRIPPYPGAEDKDTLTAYLVGLSNWEDYLTVSENTLNNDIVFRVPKHIFVANINTTIELSYQVSHSDGSRVSSGKLILSVKDTQIMLAAPSVVEAVSGLLDPILLSNKGAEVHIPGWINMKAGDGVTLYWGGSYSAYQPISGSMVGSQVIFNVPLPEVLKSSGQTITIRYQVTQLDGTSGSSQLLTLQVLALTLPAPTIVQATADGNLNIDAVPNGAEVLISASARLQTGDTLTLTWVNSQSGETWSTNTVIHSDAAGLDYKLLVPENVVRAAVGGGATLNYSIRRGQQTYYSPSARYTVVDKLIDSNIKVLGARYAERSYRYMGKSRYLVGYDRESHTPLALNWQYDNDTVSVTAIWFKDTSPWKKLRVSSASETVVLLPLNVLGNGDDISTGGNGALLARLDSGKVITWGSALNGGDFTSTFNLEAELCASSGAFAAIGSDRRVVAWGDKLRGGVLPEDIAELDNISTLSGSSEAFCALLTTGRVVAWGDGNSGGTIPRDIAAFNNIVKVVGSGGAFAALRSNKRVAVWGVGDYGGLLTTEISRLTNVKDIASNYTAFVALTEDNKLHGWGNSASGGALPAAVQDLSDINEIMASNARAFVARRANGQLVAWGMEEYGGQLPAEFASITDIIEVVSTWNAFIALRSNGTLIAWGNSAGGSVLPPALAQYRDVVQIATTSTACAALRATGDVISWGSPQYGGNSNAVASRLVGCRAIYSSSGAFAALTEDKRIITWGDSNYGGDNASVASAIDGLISYQSLP